MNYRLLVVDDNSANRLLMSCILNKMNYSHDLAENGKIALEMIEYVKYDLVLMDLFMPVMDGFEALNKIKNHKDSYISKIPVITVTAKPDSEGINEFDAIIPKPIRISFFQKTLHKFFRRALIDLSWW